MHSANSSLRLTTCFTANCASGVVYFWTTIRNISKAVIRRCSVKILFLLIWENWLENTSQGVSFFNNAAGLRQFPLSFAKVLRKDFFHRASPVAAFDFNVASLQKRKNVICGSFPGVLPWMWSGSVNVSYV